MDSSSQICKLESSQSTPCPSPTKKKTETAEKSSHFGGCTWDDDNQRQISFLLQKKLGKDNLASRVGAGNAKFTYIESWRSIQLANAIFGFNGWSCSVVDISPDYIEDEKGRFHVGVTAIVRVTLKDGTFHEDVGYGIGENPKRGLAIEKAKKEAISDARKRALRLFGDALGNCLYDKNHLKRIKSTSGNQGDDMLNLASDLVKVIPGDSCTQQLLVKVEEPKKISPSPPNTRITPSPPSANNPVRNSSPTNNASSQVGPSVQTQHVSAMQQQPPKGTHQNTNRHTPYPMTVKTQPLPQQQARQFVAGNNNPLVPTVKSSTPPSRQPLGSNGTNVPNQNLQQVKGPPLQQPNRNGPNPTMVRTPSPPNPCLVNTNNSGQLQQSCGVESQDYGDFDFEAFEQVENQMQDNYGV